MKNNYVNLIILPVFFLLLLLPFRILSGQSTEKPVFTDDHSVRGEEVLATVGKIKISSTEFLANYQFGPAFLKRLSNARSRYLNTMIHEKLLAAQTTMATRASLGGVILVGFSGSQIYAVHVDFPGKVISWFNAGFIISEQTHKDITRATGKDVAAWATPEGMVELYSKVLPEKLGYTMFPEEKLNALGQEMK